MLDGKKLPKNVDGTSDRLLSVLMRRIMLKSLIAKNSFGSCPIMRFVYLYVLRVFARQRRLCYHAHTVEGFNSNHGLMHEREHGYE